LFTGHPADWETFLEGCRINQDNNKGNDRQEDLDTLPFSQKHAAG
jgi:hypothetical protein